MGVFDRIKKIFVSSNTLYYPGCLTDFVLQDIKENYQKILNYLNIEFITIPEDLICCGSPVINAGYPTQFSKLKEKNLQLFKKYGISTLITNCPSCYDIFKKHYPELQVQHITQVIFANINKLPQNLFNEEISYHDPCHLGRYSEVYNEPRKVLEHMGFKISELKDNREGSLCCGGGGGLVNNFPQVASKIAEIRLSQCKTNRLITPCPMCFKHLNNNSKDVKIYEYSQVILKAIQITKND